MEEQKKKKKQWGYDKSTDYQALIDQSVKAGRMEEAAMWEAMRNEKIAGEGMGGVAQTDRYSKFLPGMTVKLPEYAWDPETDINAIALKKLYMRDADRTAEDVLGRYAGQTGGLPSSSAISAASEAAGNIRAQYAQLVPRLEQQAYDRHQDRYKTQINNAILRWQQTGYADRDVADILGVPIGTPTTDQSYRNWQQGQGEKSDAFNLAMTLIGAGQMPKAETLQAAGMDPQEAQKLVDAARAEAQATASRGYRGGGSTSSRRKKEEKEEENYKELKGDQWDTLEDIYLAGGLEALEKEATKLEAMGYDLTAFYEWLLQQYPDLKENGPLEPGARPVGGGLGGSRNTVNVLN